MKPEIASTLKTMSFSANLTPRQFETLAAAAYFVRFDKGQIIYSNDNECLGVMLLLEGELRAFLTSPSGKEVTLYRLGEDEICIMSASCALKSISFDVTVEALSDCLALLIPISAFEKVMHENIYVENFANQTAVAKFSEVMWAMEQLLFLSFDKRLATFLYDESVKNKSLIIRMTHEQIARLISSAREVVSRMLKHFEKEGILALASGNIEILSKERLAALIRE